MQFSCAAPTQKRARDRSETRANGAQKVRHDRDRKVSEAACPRLAHGGSGFHARKEGTQGSADTTADAHQHGILLLGESAWAAHRHRRFYAAGVSSQLRQPAFWYRGFRNYFAGAGCLKTGAPSTRSSSASAPSVGSTFMKFRAALMHGYATAATSRGRDSPYRRGRTGRAGGHCPAADAAPR
jgi:hypothetical protein